MSKVAVITDSTSRIPEKLTEGLPIFTLPLIVTGREALQGRSGDLAG